MNNALKTGHDPRAHGYTCPEQPQRTPCHCRPGSHIDISIFGSGSTFFPMAKFDKWLCTFSIHDTVYVATNVTIGIVVNKMAERHAYLHVPKGCARKCMVHRRVAERGGSNAGARARAWQTDKQKNAARNTHVRRFRAGVGKTGPPT